jgi:hypothetical protein
MICGKPSDHTDERMLFAAVLFMATSTLFPDGFQNADESFERLPPSRVAQLLTDGVAPEFPFRRDQ